MPARGEYRFAAGDTLIVPAGVLHALVNTGSEPIDAIAALPLGTRVLPLDG